MCANLAQITWDFISTNLFLFFCLLESLSTKLTGLSKLNIPQQFVQEIVS